MKNVVHIKLIEIKSFFILSMLVTYVINFFVRSYIFNVFLAIIMLIVFVCSLITAKKLIRILCIVMFILSIFLHASKGEAWINFLPLVTINAPLLALIMLVPLLFIPVRLGGYLDAIKIFFGELASYPNKLFAGTTAFLFFISPILNLGTVRIINETIKDFKVSSEFVAKAYLPGFSTAMIWSPYFSSVALVLHYLHIPITKYLSIAFPFAVIQLLVCNLFFWMSPGKIKNVTSRIIETAGPDNEVLNKKKIRTIVFIFILLITALFGIEHYTKWPMTFIVSLTAITFPILWSIIIKKQKLFLRSVKAYNRNLASSSQ